MYIYIWDWGDHQLRLICAQVRHPSPAGTFTRVPGRCLHWSPTSPGPRWPPVLKYITIWWMVEILRLYIRYTHTHTLPLAGWCLCKWGEGEDEGGMKVRWTWKWDERLLNQNAKRGTRKKREKTHTNTPGPERANPERAREKKSRGPTDTEQDQRRGGKTEAPEPTWHSENLHQPQHATGPTYLGREERMK